MKCAGFCAECATVIRLPPLQEPPAGGTWGTNRITASDMRQADHQRSRELQRIASEALPEALSTEDENSGGRRTRTESTWGLMTPRPERSRTCMYGIQRCCSRGVGSQADETCCIRSTTARFISVSVEIRRSVSRYTWIAYKE